jgi:Fe-S-cluster-containing dehydrogenase component
MARYGLVIDIKKCTGCYNCFLTCRDEFAGNAYPGYSAAQPMTGMDWIKPIEKERGQYPKVKVSYIPVTCMHCDEATCVKMARDGAVYKRPDGIVMIDPEKAKGQKDILETCPYRVIQWNAEAQVPAKCTLCAHMLDAGEPQPRCVESCPTGAIVFGDLDDPDSEIAKLVKSAKPVPMHPEFALNEKVTYIDLPKKFVAGTVILRDKGEAAVGAKVSMTGDGEKQETITDGWGDFEFEKLEDNAAYTVRIELEGYTAKELKVQTQRDVSLGDIVLEK